MSATIPGILRSASPLRAELFGASPSASAAVNTAAIQTALDAGEWVTLVTPGTYMVTLNDDASDLAGLPTVFAIGAGKRLTLGQGVTIKLQAFSDCYFIVDAEGMDVESPDIVIEGGTWDQDGRTSAGVNTNQQPNLDWPGHATIFRRAHRLIVRDSRWLNVSKYPVYCIKTNYFLFENLYFDTGSAGVQFNGPSRGGVVRTMRGRCADNMVGIVTDEGQYYPQFEGEGGDITDLLVENVVAEDSVEPVRMTGAPEHTISDVTIRNLRGNITEGHGVSLMDDILGLTGCVMTRIRIEDVDIEVPTGATAVSIAGSAVEDVTVDGLVVRGNAKMVNVTSATTTMKRLALFNLSHAGDFSQDQIANAGTIADLTIDGVRVRNTANAGSFSVFANNGAVANLVMNNVAASFPNNVRGILLQTVSGSITRSELRAMRQTEGLWMFDFFGGTQEVMLLDGAEMRVSAASGQMFKYRGTGHPARFQLSNAHMHNGNAMFETASTVTGVNIEAINLSCKGLNQMLAAFGPMTMQFNNLSLENTAYFAVTSHANAVVRLAGYGLVRRGTGTGVVYRNAGTFAIDCPDARYSLQTITSAAEYPSGVAAWDRIYNTNAGHPLGVGPVIYNGTAWEKNGRV